MALTKELPVKHFFSPHRVRQPPPPRQRTATPLGVRGVMGDGSPHNLNVGTFAPLPYFAGFACNAWTHECIYSVDTKFMYIENNGINCVYGS